MLHQISMLVEPTAGFERRVWNRIHSAELAANTKSNWWQRPFFILGAASATALILLTTSSGLATWRTGMEGRTLAYDAIGLSQFENYPKGSLAAAYFNNP